MRCRECNVDLPETYTACPLCGAKASPDAPVIEGIRTAEYPKVETAPVKKDPFRVFVCIWAVLSAFSLALSGFGFVSDLLTVGIICFIPCVWTLVFRPLVIKQLYAGNFIVMNLLPFALASLLFSKIQYESTELAFTALLPVCCIAVLVALTVLIFAKQKTAKRAAAYPVLIGMASVIAAVYTFSKFDKLPLLWLGVIVLCVCILAILFFMNPEATKEELKAKFSIQRSVSKIKNEQ